MTLYNEDEYLLLSGIQHFAYCRRQWALIHVEQQWQENYHTVKGQFIHKNVHDKFSVEKRGNLIISRGMPVFSRMLGISGECDVVEFIRDSEGITIFGREGLYKPSPVEYKKGEPKESEEDVLQLAAQVMCLEEMFCTRIDRATLYYDKVKKRVSIKIDEELRSKVIQIFNEMHQYYKRGHTPVVKKHKGCNSCSLKDICIPNLKQSGKVDTYIQRYLQEGIE